MSGTMPNNCPDVSNTGCIGPRNVCQNGTMVCTDLTSVIIQAILNLKQVNGSNSTDILAEVQTLCPDQAYSQPLVDDALNMGARKGIFYRYYATLQSIPTFMINAKMVCFNYQNRQYNRLPCRFNSFWACGNN